MKKSEIIFGVLRLPVDFLMIALAFFSAYHVRKEHDLIPYYEQAADLSSFPDAMTYVKTVGVFVVVLLLLLIIYRSYSFKIYNTYSREAKSILTAWLSWVGLILLYYFVLREFPFSRLVIMFGWFFSFGFLLVGRGLIKGIQLILLKYGIGKRKIALIGYNSITKRVIEEFNRSDEYEIIGIFHSRKPAAEQLKKLRIKYLGSTADLETLLKKRRIEEIVHTENDLNAKQSNEIIQLCREHHVHYHFIPDEVQLHKTKIDVQLINGYPLISFKITPLEGWGKVVKRIFDIVGALVAFVIIIPLSILVSIAIKLDSRGPILFTRLDDGSPVVRVGERGRLFKFYKFRSMRDKTHNQRYTSLAAKNKRKGPMVKIVDDPRITKVGRFIRKYDIDEWPQFWNILKGDMSLVGPRPHLPEEVARYEKHHKFVLSIKPGLTGLPQVSGRSNLDFEDEVALDTFYIENWSLWLDIKICLKTAWVIIRGRGE